jgi:hypothetical protein
LRALIAAAILSCDYGMNGQRKMFHSVLNKHVPADSLSLSVKGGDAPAIGYERPSGEKHPNPRSDIKTWLELVILSEPWLKQLMRRYTIWLRCDTCLYNRAACVRVVVSTFDHSSYLSVILRSNLTIQL